MMDRRISISLLFAAAFAGFTLYSAARNAWAIPVFAALTFYYAVPPYVAWRRLRRSHALRLIWMRLPVLTYAMAWFVGLIVGRPTQGKFWLLFFGVLAIGSPAVLLGRRFLVRESPGHGVER